MVVFILMEDRRLLEAPWWELPTDGCGGSGFSDGSFPLMAVGDLGLVLIGRAILSKSLNQFSVGEQGCVPSLLFCLSPNYGRDNSGNGNLLQKDLCQHYFIQFPWLYDRQLLTHTSTRDSWTLTGKSNSVSVGSLLLSPGCWCTQVFFFFLMPSKSLFPQSLFLGLLLCPWMWGIFFRWDPTFSCQWLVSSKLEFWSSYRRRWVHVLLLHQEPNYLFLYPKTHIGKAMVFTSHVWMWELDHKQGWTLNNWCFQTVVL